MAAYEVEEKFQLVDSAMVETRLKELGFAPSKQVQFVDWYFDTDKNDLSLQDCWLRFRGTSNVDGDWELKKGQTSDGGTTKTTVYEEIVGEEALAVTKQILLKGGCAMMRDATTKSDDSGRGNSSLEAPPPLPDTARDLPIQAFCSLETKRSSWQVDKECPTRTHVGLSVDLDVVTNTGYSVGEVEMVVEHKDQIKDAYERVQAMISELTEGSETLEGPVVGKLERFLITHRPDHYEALLQAGVIKKR